MSRWKEMPDTVDHRIRELTVHLRRLKDHSGLSLAALAARTTYSKSSWERYLNGKTLPPGAAVEELARVAGVDPARLTALHEAAEAAREPATIRTGDPLEGLAERPDTAVAPADPVTSEEPAVAGAPVDGEPAAGSRRRPGAPAVAAAAAVLLAAGVLPVLAPWQDEAPRDPRVGAHEGEEYKSDGREYPCRIRKHKGLVYAGHTPTLRAVLKYNTNGWEVVEVQCLLRRAGHDPGVVDGIYGDRTVRAVERAQSGAGISRDGVVGEETWRVLRK